jgi:hypothetical protein
MSQDSVLFGNFSIKNCLLGKCVLLTFIGCINSGSSIFSGGLSIGNTFLAGSYSFGFLSCNELVSGFKSCQFIIMIILC